VPTPRVGQNQPTALYIYGGVTCMFNLQLNPLLYNNTHGSDIPYTVRPLFRTTQLLLSRQFADFSRTCVV
jgi:hypothetical protein